MPVDKLCAVIIATHKHMHVHIAQAYCICISFVETWSDVQTDRFSLEAADLGKLFKVKIRHDDSNLSSDWFLDRVEVHDPNVAEPSLFHCERWLAKKKDDGKLERSLYVKVRAAFPSYNITRIVSNM